MPKFKKEIKKKTKKKKKKISEEEFAFRSVFLSAVLGGIFLLISFFFNGTEWFFNGIIVHVINRVITWDVETMDIVINVNDFIDNGIRVGVILLFFFFSLVSIANYKEITGKPANMREIMLLVGLSLVQTIRNLWVFIFTLVGLVGVLIYLYLVQES